MFGSWILQYVARNKIVRAHRQMIEKYLREYKNYRWRIYPLLTSNLLCLVLKLIKSSALCGTSEFLLTLEFNFASFETVSWVQIYSYIVQVYSCSISDCQKRFFCCQTSVFCSQQRFSGQKNVPGTKRVFLRSKK